MEKFDTYKMRQILDRRLDDELRDKLSCMLEDEILNADLFRDFEFDSIEFEDMLCDIYYEFDISLDFETLQNLFFEQEPTVRNFIKIVNEYGVS